MTVNEHRLLLVKALVLCWMDLHSEDPITSRDDAFPLDELKKGLQKCGAILAASVKDVMDFPAEIKPLLEEDPTIDVLFGMNDEVNPS